MLQGLAVCAVCGERMTLRYHTHRGRQVPEYMCQRREIEHALPVCQRIPGAALDAAIGRLLVESVTPLTLEVALAVQQELESRAEECEQLRLQEVEQARYQSDLARRRYLQVDPDNRLVADCLEADWNTALRALVQAQERYEHQRQAEAAGLTTAQRASILALAQDFPRLWNDPQTPDRERKRMARLLLADVTLLKADAITAQVRFHGGVTHTLNPRKEDLAARVRQLTGGRGADFVFEAAGTPETMAVTTKLVRKGGTIVLIGYTGRESDPFDLTGVTLGELNVLGSLAFCRDFPVTLKLMEEGKLKVRPVLTHFFPLEKAEEGIRLMQKKQEGVLKVVVHGTQG